MRSLFKKTAYVFSVFIFMFSGLFFNVKAKVVVKRNSDNNICLVRYETPKEIKRLKEALMGLKEIFSGAVLSRGCDTKVSFEDVWTFMSIEYINRFYNYEISKFLTNFILEGYRNCNSGIYTMSLGDLNNCITQVLDFIGDEDTWQDGDDEFLEIEMQVTTEQA